jgi:hypothetical protein
MYPLRSTPEGLLVMFLMKTLIFLAFSLLLIAPSILHGPCTRLIQEVVARNMLIPTMRHQGYVFKETTFLEHATH